MDKSLAELARVCGAIMPTRVFREGVDCAALRAEAPCPVTLASAFGTGLRCQGFAVIGDDLTLRIGPGPLIQHPDGMWFYVDLRSLLTSVVRAPDYDTGIGAVTRSLNRIGTRYGSLAQRYGLPGGTDTADSNDAMFLDQALPYMERAMTESKVG